MAMMASNETNDLTMNLNSRAHPTALSRNVYFGCKTSDKTPAISIKKLKLTNNITTIAMMEIYFEKKILPVDNGDAKTCFHVLFLYSICGIKLQVSITNIGNKKTEKLCHPSMKCVRHGSTAIRA